MNLIDQYKKSIRHNTWANREVYNNIRKNNLPAPECIKLLSHIAAAEFLWIARLREERGVMNVWPELDIKYIGMQLENLSIIWSEIEENLPNTNMDKEISYANSKGEKFKSSIGDMLWHVFQHSSYHRGQIALKMRELGGDPAYTDYIHSIRNNLVQL
jgi:uncharacterized damage-inducible protein DinB